jgi:hypothetical protein
METYIYKDQKSYFFRSERRLLFLLKKKLKSYRGNREIGMAEKLAPKEAVSFEELLRSNVIEQEALVNLLERRGVITTAELLEEIKRLTDKQNKVKVR